LVILFEERVRYVKKVKNHWDRQTDLFVGTELIAPDVLFKTTNAEALKKHGGYLVMCSSGGRVSGLLYLLI